MSDMHFPECRVDFGLISKFKNLYLLKSNTTHLSLSEELGIGFYPSGQMQR